RRDHLHRLHLTQEGRAGHRPVDRAPRQAPQPEVRARRAGGNVQRLPPPRRLHRRTTEHAGGRDRPPRPRHHRAGPRRFEGRAPGARTLRSLHRQRRLGRAGSDGLQPHPRRRGPGLSPSRPSESGQHPRPVDQCPGPDRQPRQTAVAAPTRELAVADLLGEALRPPLPARGCRADLTTSPSGHDAETPVEKPGRPADHSCPPTAHRSRIDPERRSSPPTQFLGGSRLMLTALAATRGLGMVVPYVLVGSVAIPVSRTFLVIMVAVFGGTAGLAVGSWAVPVTAGMAAALVVLTRQVARLEGVDSPRSWWLRAERAGSILRFALPRTVSVALEQSLLWLDVVLVGTLAGTAAAGIYGGASRLIAAGFVVDTAIRVVVSPRFSRFLHEGRLAQLQD